MLVRNAFDQRVLVDSAVPKRFGKDPRQIFCLALRVVPMGDHNALCVAHGAPLQLLKDWRCSQPDRLLQWRDPLPSGCLPEGLYIDDHIVIAEKGSGRQP